MVKLVDTFTRTYGDSKEKIKMDRQKYEDAYRKAWMALILKEKENAVVRQVQQRIPAPPPKKKLEPLTEKAAIVNRMLLKGFNHTEIAEMLGVSRQAVDQLRKRYDLPRK